jgi:hypothetical protein
MEDVIDQLDALKALDSPDWDSYGAAPVSLVAKDYAKLFVYHVWSVLGTRIAFVAGPRPDGGVSVLWRARDNAKIEVCFAPLQPTSPTFIVSRAGRVKDKGQVVDVDAFARSVLKPAIF